MRVRLSSGFQQGSFSQPWCPHLSFSLKTYKAKFLLFLGWGNYRRRTEQVLRAAGFNASRSPVSNGNWKSAWYPLIYCYAEITLKPFTLHSRWPSCVFRLPMSITANSIAIICPVYLNFPILKYDPGVIFWTNCLSQDNLLEEVKTQQIMTVWNIWVSAC